MPIRIAILNRARFVAAISAFARALARPRLGSACAGCLAIGLGGLGAPAVAADLSQCGVGFVIPERPPVDGPSVGDVVDVAADDASIGDTGTSVLAGNVQVRRGALQVATEHLTYDRDTEIATATGGVKLWEEGAFVTGSGATLDLSTEITTIDDVSYLLTAPYAHGKAEQLKVSGERVLYATGASYSTCDPRDPAWFLNAADIELDEVADVGTAHDVWVQFGSVPVLYSPYLTFPLSDKRKSGLLPPRGRVSGSTGVEYVQPYYFNLAPNRDATVAARGMTNRGLQLRGEFRYLETWGEGRIAGEFMPDDREFDDNRTAINFVHNSQITNRWEANVDFSWVSDKQYLEDLGTNLSISSRRFLEREADLIYRGDGWRGLAMLQDFQTVDSTLTAEDEPYGQLPQLFLTTNLRERNRQFNLSGTAEFVNFDRNTGVTGLRADIRPSLSFPIRAAGAFIVPRISGQFTQYDLSGTARGEDSTPSRAIPTLSVDSGLVLERPLEIGSRSFVHTLEPRLFYLGIPFDDQDDLPVFDTGQRSFNYGQLFREDRFNGADRVGDANQLSVGLTTRLLTPSAEEYARFSIGQIRYFSDQEVTLPDGTPDTRSGSDIVGELGVNVDRQWRVLAGLHFDPDERRTDKQVLSLRYQPDSRRVVNLAYRFLREDEFEDGSSVEQTDISLAWPLMQDLSLVGRWNYALDNSNTLEAFAGLEYESCCWAARTVFRRYLNNAEGDHDNAIMFQLELKGLGGIGGGTVDFLERHIPGYQNNF